MHPRSIAALAILAAAVSLANADTVTFTMTNVHWHNTTYIGNATMPWLLDWYGSGSFTWTYTPGNFANGTGTLVSLQLPPWGVGPGGYPTITTIDPNGISTTLNANVDNLSYDISISFSPPLTSPTQTVNISGGSYQFAPGTYSFLTGEFDGTLAGGTVAVCASVATQPTPVTTCPSTNASFSVAAAGSAPFSYAWRKGASPINVAANPSAATPTLQLSNVSGADTGAYSCLITNACGSVASNPASLTVLAASDPACAGPACDPDLNHDGVADQGDIDYLIDVIAGGANPTGIDPDFNHDGVADQGDVDAIVNVIAGGPCP